MQICPDRSYRPPPPFHHIISFRFRARLHVQNFEDITLDGLELKKLNGITVKELSLVIFPAVEGAIFEPTFEFSFEELEDQHDAEITEADMEALMAVLVARGKIVMDHADFEAIQNELAEKRTDYEKISKRLWMLSNCDETFNDNTLDNVDSLSLNQIQFLWEAYNDLRMRSDGARGFVTDEKAYHAHDSKKEAVRELIFGVHRDGARARATLSPPIGLYVSVFLRFPRILFSCHFSSCLFTRAIISARARVVSYIRESCL
jgi:hypothetical protein